MKLAKGSVIIFPTDTVYGMGALLSDPIGQDRIYQIKGRSQTKKLAVLCGSIEQVKEIAIMSENAIKLANAFWPGALTMIVISAQDQGVFKKGDTIGVRIPNHDLAVSILLENGPMATTSVNKSGQQPLNDPVLIKSSFENDVDNIITEINGAYLNVSSTVVDMTKEEPVILREGTITKEEIFAKLSIK